ncbi:MAG TPA: ABC transporter permease [Bryobacteraceae bacterium]|nr:ABC transporter permease [Bryobacteraceae bacterium]
MRIGEALKFSVQALRANPIRSLLTMLGMVIGTASVILVVTISLTSREYILEQIQGIGSNMIFAYYETGGASNPTVSAADFIKTSDVEAVRQQLEGRIVAATGVMSHYDRMLIAGREEDVAVIGSDQHYQTVRNLIVSSGRFMDASDVELRQHVALLTEELARRLYGSRNAAVGQVIKVHQLQFTVIGTFRERVESFGQSELARETVLIPITVIRYFTPIERIDPMYVQVRNPEEVEAVTHVVRSVLESRHRPGARYRVENLTAILNAAKSIALILTGVLIMVSAIALVISGIGIMNIMLVTVTERTREIGVRMAVGASRREILMQFLTEATLVSLGGGVIGIIAGISVPLGIRLFVDNVQIPISSVAILVAFGVSCAVGLVFGMLPANRASRLNPTEALRYE